MTEREMKEVGIDIIPGTITEGEIVIDMKRDIGIAPEIEMTLDKNTEVVAGDDMIHEVKVGMAKGYIFRPIEDVGVVEAVIIWLTNAHKTTKIASQQTEKFWLFIN